MRPGRLKTEGGSGGKRGHSGMTHWKTTEEIRATKAFRRARRASARNRLLRLAPSSYGPAIMPKVFEKDGFRFFFYSNERRPIHVHARYGDGEAVFDVEPVVELRECYGLRVAQELAEEHRELITEKWHELLG